MKGKLSALACTIVGITIVTFGCSSSEPIAAYQKAQSLPSYQQQSFNQYVEETKQWLAENRVFITDDKQAELAQVLPKEYQPANPNGQGILLVHGLGDSPYSFVDVATHLASQGYLVRTILLPGHASKVGDLQLPTVEDWQGVVDHHIELLKKDTDGVWLGGYSTGANLVTTAALKDDQIEGLLLFSPALQPHSSSVQFAEMASYFVTWADQDPEDNPLRYNSLPMNAAAVYYQTSADVRRQLEAHSYDKPVFMLLSEGDRVISTQFAIDTFASKMTNPANQLVWQGEQDLSEPRSTRFSMKLPTQHISNGSHMGLLFSPDNPNYGISGSQRICSNGQGEEAEKLCPTQSDIWYSAWGYVEPGKVHARLTYNPYFEQSMNLLDKVMQSKS
ncbi:alpha/beta hydrolase [Vibrio brasiliensis]|jgi:alpha-beta hydrolase superfamily lysophospholipase|uniref:Putative lipoprotein n=1 Tax=Vibrio brasiliensis LMG 20546 TaxID=945543 RepID=E8LVD5_9VIBR|nr:alpha/beta fold hydrolase [Vibrio brasiliensis]EGA65520.1 putative lipoprotein [Vibrio brasiliensis LMG 20546]